MCKVAHLDSGLCMFLSLVSTMHHHRLFNLSFRFRVNFIIIILSSMPDVNYFLSLSYHSTQSPPLALSVIILSVKSLQFAPLPSYPWVLSTPTCSTKQPVNDIELSTKLNYTRNFLVPYLTWYIFSIVKWHIK